MGSAFFSESLRVSTYKIKVTDGGSVKYSFSCRGDEPLLAGIRRACCTEIPHGCFGGGCGICKVAIRSGEAEQFKPMSREHITEDEIAQGVILACCVHPRSDMEIGFYSEEAGTGVHTEHAGAQDVLRVA